MIRILLYLLVGAGLVYACDQALLPEFLNTYKDYLLYGGFYCVSAGILTPFFAKKKAKASKTEKVNLDHVNGGGAAKQVYGIFQRIAKASSDGFGSKELELIKSSLKKMKVGDIKKKEFNLVVSGKRLPLIMQLSRSEPESFSYRLSSTPAFCRKLEALVSKSSAKKKSKAKVSR